MQRSAAARAAILAVIAAASALPTSRAAVQPAPLTPERIMADPDWIGPPVRGAYWSADGRSVYYSLKRSGSPLVDLHRIDLADGADRVVDGKAMAAADAAPVFDPPRKHAAFVRNGDLFLRTLPGGRLTQITRGTDAVSAPLFSADGARLVFRIAKDWFVYDLASGLHYPAAIVKAEKDPDAPPAAGDLHDFQLRTFATLQRLDDEKQQQLHETARLRGADPTRAPAPFYLGDDLKIQDTELSPNGRWMLVVTVPKSAEKGRIGKLTRYVTDSGYEELEDERVRVGHNPPAPQSLLLLDLTAHTVHALSLEDLPGIHDDPLLEVRAENARALPASAAAKGDAAAAASAAGKTRSVIVVEDEGEDARSAGIAWSRAGDALAIELFSIDNKDRWIASVDFARFALVPEHRLTNPAWVGESFNALGWLNDGRTLWFESEESGFAQLYTRVPGGATRRLTEGRFEVDRPVLSGDGRWFYFIANAEAPYAADVYRLPSGGGPLERLTHWRGVEAFALSADDRNLLVTHSASYVPPELAIARADGGGAARELTDTRTADYKGIAWIAPRIVEVPSTHFAGSIYAKIYEASPAQPGVLRPAVVFVHGAGYLQNVHLRFPYYFREQMFHNLLARRGYVVIDMDYRASAGYGSEWRTAIYRQMGHPELEDLLDGKKWLVEQAGVDPRRVGIYGGSYGGFMTLMALFRAPGEFAAGAALRPVTDWREYDHGYTAAILNDPAVDPLAYARSSPIEFAAGLADPLLICHGVIDDNVLFEDSIRLYERLIELHKNDFTLSPYPLDRHSFTNADSWLDEYKRIDRLFATHLETGAR